MLDKLVSIAKSEDLQELTELNEKQLQIIFFLLFNQEKEFSFGELKRRIFNDLSISFTDSTLSRNLKKLEKRQLITWERAKKLRYDQRSKITFIIDDIEQKLEVQRQIEKAYLEFEKVRKEAQSMNEKDTAYELIDIIKKQAGASLYLRLLLAQDILNETQFSIGFLWINLFYEKIQELYIEVAKERGKKSVEDVTHYFLQSGTETENYQP